MNWVHSTFYITIVLKSVLSAPTNTIDITSAERKTVIVDENDQITTSKIKDGALKDDLKKADHLVVKLFKSKGNPQSAVNISSNDKNNLSIDKEHLKNIVLSEAVEQIIRNSSTVGNYTLKGYESVEKSTSDGTKAVISSLDIEHDDDPIEVLKSLNELLMDTEDHKTINEVKSRLENYFMKVKNISKSETQSVHREYDKAESAIYVTPYTPSEPGVLTIIKDLAAVAGHFLGSLIKIPFKVFDTVKKSFADRNSYTSQHQSAPRQPTGGFIAHSPTNSLIPSTPTEPKSSISLYCLSITSCIEKIVFD